METASHTFTDYPLLSDSACDVTDAFKLSIDFLCHDGLRVSLN